MTESLSCQISSVLYELSATVIHPDHIMVIWYPFPRSTSFYVGPVIICRELEMYVIPLNSKPAAEANKKTSKDVLLDIKTSLPCTRYKHCTEKSRFLQNLTAGLPQRLDLFLVVNLEETQTLTDSCRHCLKASVAFVKHGSVITHFSAE